MPGEYAGDLAVLDHQHRTGPLLAIMLRDAAISELKPDLLYLVGFTIVTMTIASMRFTKRLD